MLYNHTVMSDDENEDIITAVPFTCQDYKRIHQYGNLQLLSKSTSAQCKIRNVVNSRNKLWSKKGLKRNR